MSQFGVMLDAWARRGEDVDVWFTDLSDETPTQAKIRNVQFDMSGKVVGVWLDVPRGDDPSGPIQWTNVHYDTDDIEAIARRT